MRVGDPQTVAVISGNLKAWHRVTLIYDGPTTDESDAINPFLDYRLETTFTDGDESFVVPGFYAADGNALESGATGGSTWAVRFAPSTPGTWSYTTSFRTGTNVAVSDDPLAGSPTFFDGDSGVIEIAPTDKTASDCRALGRLQYAGDHYLRFAETGDPFVKGGADSPENWLGYPGFETRRTAAPVRIRQTDSTPSQRM